MTDDHFKVTKPGSGKDWMPDEALEALSLERSVQPSLSGPQLAQRLIDENVAQAAISVIHLALHSSNENTRLRACQEILLSLIHI